MGEVWPTAHVAELSCSLPAQGLETEMNTTLQSQSCERLLSALMTVGDVPYCYNR